METPDDVKRDAVAKRAAARWEQVIKGAPGVAYDEYMSKASRRVVSRGQFEGTVSKTAFKTATVEKVECGQDSCKATVVVTYDSRIIARAANVERTIKGIQNTMVESWIIEDGQVWYVWPQ